MQKPAQEPLLSRHVRMVKDDDGGDAMAHAFWISAPPAGRPLDRGHCEKYYEIRDRAAILAAWSRYGKEGGGAAGFSASPRFMEAPPE